MRRTLTLALTPLALAACSTHQQSEPPTPEEVYLEELAERGVYVSPDAEADLIESARLICLARADGVETDSLRPFIVTAIGREVVADQVIASAEAMCEGQTGGT